MNRAVIHIGLAITSVALLWCAQLQHQRLNRLRIEENQVLNTVNASDASPATADSSRAIQSASSVSAELLKLRSTLTRLEAQKREWAGVRAENERLQQRLSATTTTSPTAPVGSFTRETVRFVGYNSPEDTVQSAFWAIQNRDAANLMQAFTPEMAKDFQKRVPTNQLNDFLEGRGNLFSNITILDRTAMPDGSVELSILTSGNTSPEKTRFYLVNGQWKIGQPAH